MLFYVVRRLLWTPVLVLAVSFVTFFLALYGPGDPIQVLLGQHQDPEIRARIAAQRGLDRPFMEQYARYIWNAVQGDLGESIKFRGQAVAELLAGKIWTSAKLGLVALVIGLAVGIPLGLVVANKQGTWMDPFVVSIALFFSSLPVFITAPVLLLAFVIWLKLMPSAGWAGDLADPRLIMPALVMALPSISALVRLMRASTLEVLGQDFIRTARSKGLTEIAVQSRHVARNALIPVITVVGLSLGTLVEGAFITETIFGIPGVGRLAVDALFARDYPVIMAMTLLIAVSFVLANLLVDIAYAFIDPRIRYS